MEGLIPDEGESRNANENVYTRFQKHCAFKIIYHSFLFFSIMLLNDERVTKQ